MSSVNFSLSTILMAFAAVASAQSPDTASPPFQVTYAPNLDLGDSVFNITNTGAGDGNICVNVYAFSPDEQMAACCSCPVTPNGLVSISAQKDLLPNVLTPGSPSALVVKFFASTPVGGSCASSSVTPGPAASGMLSWGARVHFNGICFVGGQVNGNCVCAGPPFGPFNQLCLTESPALPATLSDRELGRLTQLCSFIVANGSGFGICRSCRYGALGANKN